MPKQNMWDDPDFCNVSDKGGNLTKRLDIADRKSKTTGFGPDIRAQVGICADCGYYEMAINDVHQVVWAYCGYRECRLGRHKLADCTQYKKKGQMSLPEMYAIATLIEPNKKHIKGFGT
jgi:hypothetical protein